MSYYGEAERQPARSHAGEADSENGAIRATMNWLGAAISVVLIGGFVVWGYQLAVRDVSEVPVIRALDGPIRTVADDPGGVLSDRPALAVDEVQSRGSAQAPAERVILAPPPITLSAEDAPASTPIPVARAETIAEGVTRVEDVVGRTDAEDPSRKRAERRLADLPGVAVSPRPRARPTVRVAALDIDAAVKAANAQSDVDAAPEEVQPGERLVQLGAFDEEHEARSEWERLIGLHADLLGEKKRLIQRAESGGKAFYRLRAVGFADLSDARRMCSALMARRVNCIPVTAR